MNSVLDNEAPNLVVLNGDLISCEWVASQDANKLIDQIVAPLASRSIPFAATFGNHDASQTCDTRSMSEHMWWDVKGANGKKLSFTTQSVAGDVSKVGWSNYYIPVYSSTDSTELKMLLWFFDSKGGRVYQPGAGDVAVDNWVDEKVQYASCKPLTDINFDRLSHGSLKRTASSDNNTAGWSQAWPLCTFPYMRLSISKNTAAGQTRPNQV